MAKVKQIWNKRYFFKKTRRSSYIECELTISELEEFVGELSYEANHNKKKQIANQVCKIADCLENQLWSAKYDANKQS